MIKSTASESLIALGKSAKAAALSYAELGKELRLLKAKLDSVKKEAEEALRRLILEPLSPHEVKKATSIIKKSIRIL